MKKIKLLCVIALLIIAAAVSACSAGDFYKGEGFLNRGFYTGNEYNEITENPFVPVSKQPKSSFAMDSNTAAYSNIRRYINEYRQIDKNMVRIEEMVNYFRYDYALPEDGEPAKCNRALKINSNPRGQSV